MTTNPTSTSVGTSLANLIWFSLLLSLTCRLLPGRPGARVRRQTGPLLSPGGIPARPEHCARPGVCQEIDMCAQHNVQGLDKPLDAAMICAGVAGRASKTRSDG